MRLIDVNDLESNAAITVDVCIIGAGAAGITVTAESDEASQTLCRIEAGIYSPDVYSPDEETQSPYDIEVAGYPVGQNLGVGVSIADALDIQVNTAIGGKHGLG
jgi:hypothetical protein